MTLLLLQLYNATQRNATQPSDSTMSLQSPSSTVSPHHYHDRHYPHDRQWIRPTAEAPWTVDVVAQWRRPEQEKEEKENGWQHGFQQPRGYVATVSQPPWNCVVSEHVHHQGSSSSSSGSGSSSSTVQYRLHVWKTREDDNEDENGADRQQQQHQQYQYQQYQYQQYQYQQQQQQYHHHTTTNFASSSSSEDTVGCTLTHPLLQDRLGRATDPRPPLVALQLHAASNVVCLYAVNTNTGALVVWKLHPSGAASLPRRQQQRQSLSSSASASASPPPPSASVVVALQSNANLHDGSNDSGKDGDEYVTSLNVDWTTTPTTATFTGTTTARASSSSPLLTSTTTVWVKTPLIVVGTSTGRVFWIRQTPSPLALSSLCVQDHLVTASSSSSSSSSSFSLTHFFGRTPSQRPPPPPTDPTPVVAALPMGTSGVWVVHQAGRIVPWQVRTTGPRVEFLEPDDDHDEKTKEYHLIHLLPRIQRALLTANVSPVSEIQVVRVNQESEEFFSSTTTITDSKSTAPLMHLIVRTFHKDSECRLYWLVWNAHTQQWATDLPVWLNRFVDPANVLVSDLVVTNHNRVAYAAFSQQTLSHHHSTHAPWIVMALELLPGDGDYHHHNNNTTTTMTTTTTQTFSSSSSRTPWKTILHELDLPATPVSFAARSPLATRFVEKRLRRRRDCDWSQPGRIPGHWRDRQSDSTTRADP